MGELGSMVKRAAACILDWLYPSNIYCISCGDFIEKDKPYSLCDTCMQRLHWIGESRCSVCGKEIPVYRTLCRDCQELPRAFDLGMACVQYGRMEKSVIHSFKYKDRAYMGRHMAQLMARRVEAEGIAVEDISFTTEVPMYGQKKKRRGYNQAEVLAREIAEHFHLAYYPGCLQRVRPTAPMSSLHREERMENIKGAFQVSQKYQGTLYNSVALLVDDVYTTGSTADACAEALKASGVKTVFVITFAAGTDRIKLEE